MDKKGASLGSMYPAVLAIIVVGILLGVGLYTLNQVAVGVASDSISVVNETMSLVDSATGDTVATASDCQARDFNVTTPVFLTSSGVTINSANWTFSNTGVLIAAAGSEYNNTNVNASYSYTGTLRTGTTDSCTALATSGTGTGGFASWIAVIVVVLAAAIVLGVVLSSFGRNSGV